MTNDNERMVPEITIEKALDCYVVKINGQVAMMHCPYCLRAFEKIEHAQRCIDALWPPKTVGLT